MTYDSPTVVHHRWLLQWLCNIHCDPTKIKYEVKLLAVVLSFFFIVRLTYILRYHVVPPISCPEIFIAWRLYSLETSTYCKAAVRAFEALANIYFGQPQFCISLTDHGKFSISGTSIVHSLMRDIAHQIQV